MTTYWLLFAFAALMALASRDQGSDGFVPLGQRLGLLAFLVAYALVAGLRFEIGGDWLSYEDMYSVAQTSSLSESAALTDPVFGLLLWLSAKAGGGVYLVNGVCAWILGYGVMRIALRTRDPWLAVLIALPYLLIVVGMGYIRQAAAMGMIMLAVDSLGRSQRGRTIVYLLVAAGFHSTASIVFPLFGYAMTQRYRVVALILAVLGTIAFGAILLPRLNDFEAGYLDSEYDSSGATVRLAMNVLPAFILFVSFRRFVGDPLSRALWFGTAVASVLAIVALQFSPSSTAVDRIGLYLAMIQVMVFGNIIQLLGVNQTLRIPVRLMVVALAAAIQLVFLVFGTHAAAWVPYKSILTLL